MTQFGLALLNSASHGATATIGGVGPILVDADDLGEFGVVTTSTCKLGVRLLMLVEGLSTSLVMVFVDVTFNMTALKLSNIFLRAAVALASRWHIVVNVDDVVGVVNKRAIELLLIKLGVASLMLNG